MKTHEEIRKMLALAAAGGLDAVERVVVDRHAVECEACRRELEILGVYAAGLAAMPQPMVPERLLEKTRLRVAEAGWAAAERRTREMLLVLLAVLSSVGGVGLWLVVREVTGGGLSALGISTLLVWMTAGVAVVVLGKRDEVARRIR